MESIIKDLMTIDKIDFNLDYLIVAFIFSTISSTCIIILDLILKKYKIKFLNIELNGWDYLLWICGSFITYTILFCLKIVPFNIQSMIITSLIWTKLILENYKSISNTSLKKEEESTIKYEIEI